MPLQLTLPDGEVTSDADEFDLAWKLHRVVQQRDRLEAAIDRHRADMLSSTWDTQTATDRALYAALQKIRDERDAAPGGRGGEP